MPGYISQESHCNGTESDGFFSQNLTLKKEIHFFFYKYLNFDNLLLGVTCKTSSHNNPCRPVLGPGTTVQLQV